MEYDRIIGELRYNKIFWGTCCVILLLNLFFYASIIKKQSKKIDELRYLYAKTRHIENFDKNDKTTKYILARDAIQSFRDKLLDHSTFPDYVKELYNAINGQGLSIGTMTFKPELVDNFSLWKYTTSFKVSGQYAKLKGLLAEIQESPSLFCIESLSFKNQSKNEELVDLNLSISTYFRPSP